MTNYSAWDSKAERLTREADEDSKREEEESNRALGLGSTPQGPPVANAEAQLKDLDNHSEERKKFIGWSKDREVSFTHKPQDAAIELSDLAVDGKAVRLIGSEDVIYTLSEKANLVKLMVDKCIRVRLRLDGSITTSTMEIYKCSDLELELQQPLGTIQVDECTESVTLRFAERDHVGCIYHQNSPGLAISWTNELHQIGDARAVQHCTKLGLEVEGAPPLVTAPVRRGEGEYPVDFTVEAVGLADQPEPEAAPASEERRQQAEQFRIKGNDMFRANDFMQAALQYSQALELDPSVATIWANRAQCWLKVGDHEKALADATRCTEVDASNAKGWFRKGMSLHAMKRFPEAVPALLEAEKLDPANKQIQDAIRMAQLMARKHANCS